MSTRIDNYHVVKDKSKNYWVLWLTWFDDNWYKDEEEIIDSILVNGHTDIKEAATQMIKNFWQKERSDQNLTYGPEFITMTGMLDMDDIENLIKEVWSKDGSII